MISIVKVVVIIAVVEVSIASSEVIEIAVCVLRGVIS
jgi:hypothetical protein